MAEHNVEKIVEAGGEVFNFRDPTKQPVADRVTSVRAASSATNTKYPTEKAVAVELEKMIPFGYAIFDTNPFGGKHLYINSISDAMFSMDKRYYVTATTHKIVDNGVEYPRIKEGAVETDDVYYEDSPVLEALTDSQIRNLFNGFYDSGFAIGDGKYLKIHIQFSNEENWSPSTGGYFPGCPYGDYFLSFYYSRVPESAQWRCYNRYTIYQQTAGWKKGNFGYFEGNASSVASVILKGTDNSNYQRSCIEIIVFARDGVNTMLTQIDWRLSRPTLANHFPFFTNFDTQKSYVNWEFRQKVSSSPVIKFDVDNEKIVANNLELTNALPVSYGGTGKSSVTSGNYLVGNGTSAMVEKTPKEVGSNVLSSLDDKSNASSYANFVDGDFVVGSDHVNASTISASTFVRRTALNLWNYIKSKLSGSDVNVGGNAATAGTADTAKAYDPTFSGTNSIASALNGKSPTTHTHKTDAADVTSDDTNLGDATDGMQFVTTWADDTGYSLQHKELYRRPGVKIWNWIKGHIDSYTGVVHTTGNETITGTKTFDKTSGGDHDLVMQNVTTNGKYKTGFSIGSTGNRGLYDFGGTGIAGEDKWIIYKDSYNVIHVGNDSAQRSKVKIGGITLDFSGTIGSASNTLYIG